MAAMRAYRAEIGGKSLRIVRGEFHRHTEISSDGAGDGTLLDMWRYGIDMAAHGLDRQRRPRQRRRPRVLLVDHAEDDRLPRAGRVHARCTPTSGAATIPTGTATPCSPSAASARCRGCRAAWARPWTTCPPTPTRPNTPDTQMFYDYLRHFDGVCASHTSGTDMGTDWRDNDPKVEPIVEIYQGCRQNYERARRPATNTAEYSIGGWRPFGFVSLALMKGYRLGFQSSSDHISTHISYCNVWVEEPTREAILEAHEAPPRLRRHRQHHRRRPLRRALHGRRVHRRRSRPRCESS